MIARLDRFAPLAERYDGFVLDLWGVIHDGVKPYPAALDCLARLRDAGKSVAILSNAPRRAAEVEAKLTEMGIDRALYSDLYTSGEETWKYLKTRPDGLGQRLGRRVYAISADRDAGILDCLLDGVPPATLRPCQVDDMANAGGFRQLHDLAHRSRQRREVHSLDAFEHSRKCFRAAKISLHDLDLGGQRGLAGVVGQRPYVFRAGGQQMIDEQPSDAPGGTGH